MILLFNAWAMGGTVRTVLNTAGYLARRHDVEIVSVVRRTARPFFARPEDVAITTLDDQRAGLPAPSGWRGRLQDALRRRPSVLLHPGDRLSADCSLLTDLGLARTLWRVRGGTLMGTRPSLNLLVAAAARPGVRRIGQEHMHVAAHGETVQEAIRIRYPRLDALVTLTARDAEEYAALTAHGGTTVRAIPNALPALTGPPAEGSGRVVLAVGRLRPQKAFHRLLDAFAEVVGDHQDWRLVICGDGPRFDALRRRILRLELYNHAFLLGAVGDVERQMEQASIFALSSRREGFPMVLLEAMAKGLPVVSFDCPTGPRELVETGSNGILVPDGDVPALAAGLRRLIEDEELRRRCAAGALTTAERYRIDAIGPAWEELLAGLRA